MFLDAAHGVIQDIAEGATLDNADPENPDAVLEGSLNGSLVSAGFGIKFRYGKFFGSLNAMTPLVDDLFPVQAETAKARFLFDLQYAF